MVPPNQHEGEKNVIVGQGWAEGARHAWRWILPRWQARHSRVQAVMLLDNPCHTNLDEII